MKQIYEIKLPFAIIYIRVDLSRANDTIYVSCCDDINDVPEDNFYPIQYQTADAKHYEINAAMLAVLSMGREWYVNPKDYLVVEEIGDEPYIYGLIDTVLPINIY